MELEILAVVKHPDRSRGIVVFGGIEWCVQDIRAKLDRLHAIAEREAEMIGRSYELLAKSEELLRMPIPTIWRPELRKQ